MWKKFLGARAGNTIESFTIEFVVSCMCRNNIFFVFVINTISITMSSKETKLVFMHDINNILSIQIWRKNGCVLNVIIGTVLFRLVRTRF